MSTPPNGFNTQPPEGGWNDELILAKKYIVSTHSRPKAAGFARFAAAPLESVSTHSRPKAAGSPDSKEFRNDLVSTHSRLRAAVCKLWLIMA